MKTLTILCAIFLASCAIKKEPHPDLVNLDADLKEAEANFLQITRGRKACFKVYPATYSALENKKQGMAQETLLAPLPTRAQLEAYPTSRDAQKRLGLAMLDIAHQIYNYENLDVRAYSAYSAETCQRKLYGKEVPESFDAAYPELLKCNSLEESKRINCGMAVAGSKL